MLFFERFHLHGIERDRIVFVESVVATAIGVLGGFLLFPDQASLVGVFLVAWVQARTVEGLLERNRADIWERSVPSVTANGRLARSLLVLFMGVFVTYGALALMVPEATMEGLFGTQLGNFAVGDIREVSFGSVSSLLAHNGVVFVGGFLFALFYRHGGMLLVLAWNASRWGVIFSYVARVGPEEGAASSALYLAKTMACVLPHLLLEAVAYILVAMAGVFLSKAVAKYRLGSPEFAQVGLAVMRITLAALICLAAAAVVEASLAPSLVAWVFG